MNFLGYVKIIMLQVRFEYLLKPTRFWPLSALFRKKWLFLQKNPKRAENSPDMIGSKKIFKLHLEHNNFDISWKNQVKRTIISENILRKEKNKSKIGDFLFPGVTLLIDQRKFCSPKLQKRQNLLTK